MGLEITKAASTDGGVLVDRRLLLAADGRLVEDGDPDGAFLWAGEGCTVPVAEAAARGYQPRAVDPEAAPEPTPSEPVEASEPVEVQAEAEGGEKADVPEGDKAAPPAANKGRARRARKPKAG